MKISLLEDDPIMRKIVTTKLTNAGYRVEAFENGQDLIDNINNPADLFILDLFVPYKNGLEVLKHLKMNKMTEKIPSILISGINDLDELAERAQVNYFLEKPIDMSQLLEMVQKLDTGNQ